MSRTDPDAPATLILFAVLAVVSTGVAVILDEPGVVTATDPTLAAATWTVILCAAVVTLARQ